MGRCPFGLLWAGDKEQELGDDDEEGVEDAEEVDVRGFVVLNRTAMPILYFG